MKDDIQRNPYLILNDYFGIQYSVSAGLYNDNDLIDFSKNHN